MLDVLGPNMDCVSLIFPNPGNGDPGNKRCFLHFLFVPVLYVTLCTCLFIFYFLFVCCVLCFCARSSFYLVRTGTRISKGPRHRGLEWHAEVRIRLLVPGLNRMRQYPLLQQGYVVEVRALFLSPPRISLSLSLCLSLSIYIMLNISLSRF